MKQLIMVFVMFMASETYAQKSPLLIWSAEYRLQIQDFTPTLKELPRGRTAISSIGLQMVKDSTKRSGWRAKAVFDQTNSWWSLVGQVWAKDVILHHEQIHWDIANCVANMYNRVLDTLPFMSRTTLEKSYKFYNEKLDSMQKWYDTCTGEDPDIVAQTKCNKRVDSLINVLNLK